MSADVFDLCILGGASERRYRRLRPEIERLPWDSLDAAAFPPELVLRARRFWTQAAFQEHRTAAACAATLEAMIAARAPIDLVAVAGGFILDEMAHVELCARVAARLGGAEPIHHDPRALYTVPDPRLPPLARAAELVVRVFCVGEAFSVGMQRATARAERHPLLKAVVSRIARDESAHGGFGWLFLDWADDALDAPLRAHLAAVAGASVASLVRSWDALAATPATEAAPTLGWLPPAAYLASARKALARDVVAPLRARGLLAYEPTRS